MFDLTPFWALFILISGGDIMRKRLQGYLDYMEKISKEDLSEEKKELVLKDFFIQIRFFQNERHIHLIVTVTFALIALVSVIANFTLNSIPMIIFSLGVLVLLFFYVNHYFFLERGVQKLYTYYDLFTKDYTE